MPMFEEVVIGPEMSQEFQSFEEFCSDNTGHELTYMEVVAANPLSMDAVTLAFSLRHLLRFSRELMEFLLDSLKTETIPDLPDVLNIKGIQLDKKQADKLRPIVFAFRDSEDEEARGTFVKALQLMTMMRERKRIVLNLNESYTPPDEGWSQEDFGDDTAYETVRSVEDPRWKDTEEYE